MGRTQRHITHFDYEGGGWNFERWSCKRPATIKRNIMEMLAGTWGFLYKRHEGAPLVKVRCYSTTPDGRNEELVAEWTAAELGA